MTHFGRKVGFQWIFLGVLLIVGFLGLRWAALSEAQAPAQKHFLEKGKSYTFSWQDTMGPAVVLEEPLDNWVKVRRLESDMWINLNTVHRVTAAPQAREKKDAEKGAGEAKGTVKGTVTFLGKPVPKGKVTFHPEKGDPVEADIKDGKYTAKGLPVGPFRVTIKAESVPVRYADKNTTPLRVEIRHEEISTMDFDLNQ
jgi:hypothetical protein